MATKHIVAGLIVAVAALLVAPAAANAQTYIPSGGCTLSPSTVSAGGSATYIASTGTFGPSQSVDFSISGKDAAHASLTSGGAGGLGDPIFTSTADGTTSVAVKLPADASGQYQITGTDTAVGATCTCTLTVLPATSAVVDPRASDPVDPSDPSTSGQLAFTGQVVYTSAGWIGGGVVLLGIALLVWRRIGRRRAPRH